MGKSKTIDLRAWVIAEFKSHFTTVSAVFLAWFLFDGNALLVAIFVGDYALVTKDAIMALLIRSTLKTTLTVLFPEAFPQPQPPKAVE